MKRRLKVAFEGLAAIEFIIYLFVACSLVLVGPVIWLYRLIAADHLAAAAGVSISWLASIVAIVCEVRRGAITVLSFVIFVAWLVVLIYVFREIFV